MFFFFLFYSRNCIAYCAASSSFATASTLSSYGAKSSVADTKLSFEALGKHSGSSPGKNFRTARYYCKSNLSSQWQCIDVLFLSLFSLFKNWMQNVVWGCVEILPISLWNLRIYLFWAQHISISIDKKSLKTLVLRIWRQDGGQLP